MSARRAELLDVLGRARALAAERGTEGKITLQATRLTAGEVRAGKALEIPDGLTPPRTRGECVGGPRPCPWVRCAHHLYIDVSKETGSLTLNFPFLEVDELPESCALDIADRGEHTLKEAGEVLGLTRARIDQVVANASRKLQKAFDDESTRGTDSAFENHMEAGDGH